MNLLQSRSAVWVLWAVAVVMLSGSLLLTWSWTRTDDRVYTIGWQEVPPFQQRAEDGSPSGLAVDLIRHAAQRRGIELKWVWYPGSSEKALKNKDVDLWPLITITPERLKFIHISKPWLRHDHDLLVRDSSSFHRPEDTASASITYVDLAISQQTLSKAFPKARLVAAESQRSAVESMCAGRTDAVYVDDFTSGAILLSGVSCSSEPLRVIPLPTLRSRLGVGSTQEASVVADEIRREIDDSVVNGELVTILRHGGQYSQRNLEYLSAQLNAQRRERWLSGITATLGGLLILVLIAADCIRRQRNRIRAAGDVLRENEQKLRLMANNLTEMVVAYDMDRRLIFANPAFETLTGYSVADLESEKPLCWVHPDDRLRIHSQWDTLFRGGAFSNQEYRLVTVDGRTRWMTATWCPVYDEVGQQAGVQGSERDITERKLTEQALYASERRFRELLETIQLVAVITDRNGRIIFCNDYALGLTGWSSGEVIGRPAAKFIDAGFPPSAVDGTSSDAAICTHTLSEGTLLEKNGGRRRIRWSNTPVRGQDGYTSEFASLGVDVTELQALRAKAAQLEGEQHFRTMADTSPLMIWVAGSDSSCTFVNKGWLAFTGRTLEEEMGNGWTFNVHPDDLAYCLARFKEAFKARRDFQVECRKRRADGQYRWVLASGVALFGVTGEFSGYVGTCTDITDLKRSRDEELARQKLENVARLAAGIAHDFNNLVGIVLAQSELAMAALADSQSVRRHLSDIHDAAIRGSVIVQQLMIYAGQENAPSERVDISALIGELNGLLKVAVSKTVSVRTELAPGLPAVSGNPAQLRQLVLNLVTNASEAIGDQSGQITVRTALANVGLNSSRLGACAFVQLEVSDTGCGISCDTQSRVFDPFFTTKYTSKGLGLTVVQTIVNALGGIVQFETEPGRGTTFRILLPGVQEPAPILTPAAIPDHQANANRFVLIVEDEEPLRAAVAEMLRRNSIAVLETGDGSAAVNLIREHKNAIGAVVLDIFFPGASSRDVFAAARCFCPEAKVIVTTASGRQKADECFEGMNIDAFLRKPYRLAELVAAVSGVGAQRSV